jgi:hypothetical protein
MLLSRYHWEEHAKCRTNRKRSKIPGPEGCVILQAVLRVTGYPDPSEDVLPSAQSVAEAGEESLAAAGVGAAVHDSFLEDANKLMPKIKRRYDAADHTPQSMLLNPHPQREVRQIIGKIMLQLAGPICYPMQCYLPTRGSGMRVISEVLVGSRGSVFWETLSRIYQF